jgi:hypothetical protein
MLPTLAVLHKRIVKLLIGKTMTETAVSSLMFTIKFPIQFILHGNTKLFGCTYK